MSEVGCPVHRLRDLEDADPYPFLAAAREEMAAYWDESMNGLVLLRFADCHEVLSSDDRFPMPWNRIPGGKEALGEFGVFNLFGAEHERMHDLLLEYFNPRRNTTLRPAAERLVDLAFERAQAKPVWEFGADIADLVPGLMAMTFLGLPEDESILVAIHHANHALQVFMQSYGDDEPARVRLREQKEALRPIFQPTIDARRAEPANDLLSILVAESERSGGWDEDEMLSQCLFLFGASYGNTANALTNMVHWIVERPELRERLMANDFKAVPAYVEEIMRVWPSVQMRIRIATEDCEVGGIAIAAGTRVLPMVASANRDPAQYPEPEEIDVRRSGLRRHLAFGVGPRYCVGASLARLEAQVVIERLLLRFDELRPVVGDEPPIFRGLNYRTFRPLVFAGRTGS